MNITNATGYTNASCTASPASATNKSSNFTVDNTTLQNNVSPACLVVNTPLPVELAAFTASPKKCASLLRWQAASEEGCREYAVERSTDGSAWEKRAVVKASGSNGLHDYSYADVASGVVYYRLRMVSSTGGDAYSPTVAARVDCYAAQSVRIFPNPAAAQVTIELPGAGSYRVQVYNGTGRLIRSLETKAGMAVLETSGWPSGVYWIAVYGQNGALMHRQSLYRQ